MEEVKLGFVGYLYNSMVVANKSDIKNATEDEFEEVMIYLSESKIRDLYARLENNNLENE
jgi:hypothetical protein